MKTSPKILRGGGGREKLGQELFEQTMRLVTPGEPTSSQTRGFGGERGGRGAVPERAARGRHVQGSESADALRGRPLANLKNVLFHQENGQD